MPTEVVDDAEEVKFMTKDFKASAPKKEVQKQEEESDKADDKTDDKTDAKADENMEE